MTAIVQYHIVKNTLIYSTAISATTLTSYLGPQYPIAYVAGTGGAEGSVTVGTSAKFAIPSDILTLSGPMHAIASVLIPTSLVPVSWGNLVFGSSTPNGTTPTTTTTKSTSTAKPTLSSSVKMFTAYTASVIIIAFTMALLI